MGNVVDLSLAIEGSPKNYQYGLQIASYFFTGVFTCEGLAKIFVFGPLKYLSSKWNM